MNGKNQGCDRRSRCAGRKTAKALRWFGLALTCLVALLLFTGSASAAFPDVPGTHPYSTAIDGIAAADVISGFEDGTFGPDKPVIRQQFGKMIVKTMGLTVTGTEVCPFGDVAAQVGTDPFYPSKYAALCATHSITLGTDSTHFSPTLNIRRTQVITMVVRAANTLASDILDPVPTGWSGVLSYGDPDHGANIKKAEYNGLLAGIQGPGGTLASWDPLGYATRGEVAQILWSLWQQKVVERPFKGFLVGQIQVNWYGTPFNPPQPPTMDGIATGYFADLGLTQMTSSHILPQDPNLGWEGELTLTAANGDQLFLSYGDHLTGWEFTTPAGYVFVSHDGWFEITGGTGRFAGATGSGVTTAYHVYPGPGAPGDPVYPRYALLAPWEVTWIYEGTITY